MLGYLARITGTVFIKRDRARASDQTRHLAARLVDGESLFLFPEGTSTNGTSVRAFKSTLFGALEAAAARFSSFRVQPVTLAFTRMRAGRGVGIDVTFHPPMTFQSAPTRKALARACEAHVARGLEDALARAKADLPRPERRRRRWIARQPLGADALRLPFGLEVAAGIRRLRTARVPPEDTGRR